MVGDGDGGGGVIIVPVLYPRGTVSVSSLGYFLYVFFLINIPMLIYLYLLEHATFKSISRIRGSRNKNSVSHSRRRPGMRGI